MWLKDICEKIDFKQESMDDHCDSHSEICLFTSTKNHKMTKNIDVDVHLIRE